MLREARAATKQAAPLPAGGRLGWLPTRRRGGAQASLPAASLPAWGVDGDGGGGGGESDVDEDEVAEAERLLEELMAAGQMSGREEEEEEAAAAAAPLFPSAPSAPAARAASGRKATALPAAPQHKPQQPPASRPAAPPRPPSPAEREMERWCVVCTLPLHAFLFPTTPILCLLQARPLRRSSGPLLLLRLTAPVFAGASSATTTRSCGATTATATRTAADAFGRATGTRTCARTRRCRSGGKSGRVGPRRRSVRVSLVLGSEVCQSVCEWGRRWVSDSSVHRVSQ